MPLRPPGNRRRQWVGRPLAPLGAAPPRKGRRGTSPEAPGFSAEPPPAPEAGSSSGARARAAGAPGESSARRTACGGRSGRGAAGGAGCGPRRRGTGRKAGAPAREGGGVSPDPRNLSHATPCQKGRGPAHGSPETERRCRVCRPLRRGSAQFSTAVPAQAQGTLGRFPVMQAVREKSALPRPLAPCDIC